MWRCPVCEKEHAQGLVCDNCGFDSSCDYEHNRTLCSSLPKHVEPISVRAAKWRQPKMVAVSPDNFVCSKCRGNHFFFLVNELLLICTDCKAGIPLMFAKDGLVLKSGPSAEKEAPEPVSVSAPAETRAATNTANRHGEAGPMAAPGPQNVIAGGKAGQSVIWTLSDTGVLTLSGSGEMYGFYNASPWKGHEHKITSVVVGPGVTQIGAWAFSRCTGLTSITLSKGMTEIGSYAFYGCTSLTNITLPEGVTKIGWGVFGFCTNLISMTLPESVTEIDRRAFDGCTGLTDIYYGGTEEQWRSIYISYDNYYLLHAAIHYNS